VHSERVSIDLSHLPEEVSEPLDDARCIRALPNARETECIREREDPLSECEVGDSAQE
jgi:hypothetical protein